MYIAQVYNVLHDWWRYFLGLISVIIAVVIGQIPFTAAVFVEANRQGMNLFNIDETAMMTLLESNLNLFLMLLSFAFGLVGIFLIVKFLHRQSLTHLTTARKKIDWGRIWFAFLFWGVISTGLMFLDIIGSPDNYQWNFNLMPFLILVVIAIIMIPLQTSFEEYLFRGYLMQGIGSITKTKWAPLLITSVIFGLLHIANPEVDKLGPVIMIYYIGTGLFLGIITLMDEGLELALGFHAANNLFTALLVTADWTAFQTHSLYKDMSNPEAMGMMEVVFPVFIIFPVIILIFSRKYKWTDWSGKLLGNVERPREDYKIIE